MYAGDEMYGDDVTSGPVPAGWELDPCPQCSAGEDEPCDPWCICSDCVGE